MSLSEAVLVFVISFSVTSHGRFEQTAEAVRKWKTTPPDSENLQLYSLFKQATVGDVNIAQPGALDLRGKAKWEAWNGRKGLSQDQAKEEYIKLAEQFAPKYA